VARIRSSVLGVFFFLTKLEGFLDGEKLIDYERKTPVNGKVGVCVEDGQLRRASTRTQ